MALRTKKKSFTNRDIIYCYLNWQNYGGTVCDRIDKKERKGLLEIWHTLCIPCPDSIVTYNYDHHHHYFFSFSLYSIIIIMIIKLCVHIRMVMIWAIERINRAELGARMQQVSFFLFIIIKIIKVARIVFRNFPDCVCARARASLKPHFFLLSFDADNSRPSIVHHTPYTNIYILL